MVVHAWNFSIWEVGGLECKVFFAIYWVQDQLELFATLSQTSKPGIQVRDRVLAKYVWGGPAALCSIPSPAINTSFLTIGHSVVARTCNLSPSEVKAGSAVFQCHPLLHAHWAPGQPGIYKVPSQNKMKQKATTINKQSRAGDVAPW